jgi:hypothetical protein
LVREFLRRPWRSPLWCSPRRRSTTRRPRRPIQRRRSAATIAGGVLGGIIGGALGRGPGAVAGAIIGGTTGAVIASEAQARPGGYFWWRGGCYYRYPNGAWSQPLYPSYCGY